ncbi:MAG: SH3 domain-containing protein, partial [Kiloniellales bacterium]|nr:SH3 domain-containing protein [Kiloniellales bacterium]
PSIDAPEIAGMKVGQRLRVTGKVKGSDWFRIETAGYIDGRLIRKLELTAPATPPAPPAAATTISEIVKAEGTYVTLTYANIRERPTALARTIERIEAGTPLIAAGKVKNANWYYVRTYSGAVGYVFGELIEETAVP